MNPTPRAMILQDISGFGRCSMTTALPVLSVLGCQCCPLPTAYLSTHTGFPDNTFVDLSQAVEDAAAHWKSLRLRFDGIYSGFLSTERQVDLVLRCLEEFREPGTVALVDPVMGDHGKTYRTCTPALCAGMRRLAAHAQVITPNLTEAALLLGLSPDTRPAGTEELKDWAARLSLDGKRQVVITGVGPEPDLTGGLCVHGGGLEWACVPRVDAQFHGTGDLFASVLLGGLLQKASLPAAARKAAGFTALCIQHTARVGTPPLYGVEFEGLLGHLMESSPEN